MEKDPIAEILRVVRKIPNADIVIGSQKLALAALQNSKAEFNLVSDADASQAVYVGTDTDAFDVFVELKGYGLRYMNRDTSKITRGKVTRGGGDKEDENRLFLQHISNGDSVSLAGRKMGWANSKAHFRFHKLKDNNNQKQKKNHNGQEAHYKKIQEEATKLYAEGKSSSDIAKILGTSGFTVVRALAAAKVISRKSGKLFVFQK